MFLDVSLREFRPFTKIWDDVYNEVCDSALDRDVVQRFKMFAFHAKEGWSLGGDTPPASWCYELTLSYVRF